MPEETVGNITYNDMVAFVEEAERNAQSHQVQPTIIDLVAATNAGSVQQKRYSDVIADIGAVEAPKKTKEEKAKEQKEPGEHIIMAGLEQAKYSNPVPSPFIKEEEAAKKELDTIKERLGEIAPAIKEIRRRRVNTKDLVLPSLSLSDQIAELERIIEGVKENVFDVEHLDIVKQEVYGLSAVDERAQKERKKSSAPGSIEDSLLAVRMQRLQDAMTLLQNR